MCNWCGCQSQTKGFGGREMPNDTAKHEATESQQEQMMEYGRVTNPKAPK